MTWLVAVVAVLGCLFVLFCLFLFVCSFACLFVSLIFIFQRWERVCQDIDLCVARKKKEQSTHPLPKRFSPKEGKHKRDPRFVQPFVNLPASYQNPSSFQISTCKAQQAILAKWGFEAAVVHHRFSLGGLWSSSKHQIGGEGSGLSKK